ncbi:hypothetical protein RB195_008660 [Necator americanus]|uniref:BTB domain-containing protein n=1 Tax=Necator americanus TaxID=51031 RepID=A0ABR1CPQ6_NECAM
MISADKNNPSVTVEQQTKKGDQLTLVPKRVRCAVSMRADDTDKWGNEALDEREDYPLVLRDSSIKNDLLNRLNTFRCNRELCDIVLFVREREIFAHKVVLAAVSPALFDMFLTENEDESSAGSTNGHSENEPSTQFTTTLAVAPSTKKPMAYFDFAQTDYDCFEALVNFAYTSYLEISSKKVAELYKTAFALQMTPVVKACANFLAENLNLKNCIGIRRQANFNNDVYLLGKVDTFIQENFEKIVDESVEFTQLPCVKTRIILPAEDGRAANLEKGTHIAESALDYFNRLPHDRAEHSIEMLTHKTTLLYLGEDQMLTDCAEMDDKSSVGSCDIIQDYKRSGKDAARAASGSMEANFNAPIQHRVTGAVPVRLNASRVPNVRYSSTESLNSLDSNDSDPQDTIETRLIAMHQTSSDYWVALGVLYRRLIVLSIQLTDDEDITKNKASNGGVDPQKSVLLSRLISCTGSQRRPLATMNGARCAIGASFVNGKIIVCGGYDRGECLKSVEEYDVVRGEWKQLQSMKDERGRFDSAVLNGMVYAVAGSNGNNDLKTAEVYNPKTNQWSAIPPLSKARSHNGCAALDGFIFCVGGSSDQEVLRDCERFDVSRQVWEPIAPMELARYQAGVIAWRGLVVACGGCDRWNCMDSVEAYDPKTNTWRMLSKMRVARRGCAVAVIRDTLYVIGGHDGQQSLSSVEVLDHPAAAWRPGPPLTTPRANTHAVVTAGNVIYAIGGFNGNQFLNSIELMDSELVGWRNWQLSGPIPLTEEDEDAEPSSTAPISPEPRIEAKAVKKNTGSETTLSRSWMLFMRRQKCSQPRHQTLVLFITAVLLWICGVFDHLFETSFDEFQWPPFNVNIAAETRRAVAEKSPRTQVENDIRVLHRIVEPECNRWNPTLRLLVIVKSSVHNEQQRNAIRRTWGSHRNSSRVVFILGTAPDAPVTVKHALLKELHNHSDILHVDVVDTYRNNTLKFLHSISYAFKPNHGCPSPDFLFLVDDDYMVQVGALLQYIARKNVSQHLYEGWRFDTTPFRVRFHKHAASLKLYPFDRYPPYISAGAVLLSRETFSYFYYAMQLVKLYSFDDIYAGILAYLLGIPPTHNEAFIFWSRSIDPEEWRSGKILAAHGYSYHRILDEYPSIIGVS